MWGAILFSTSWFFSFVFFFQLHSLQQIYLIYLPLILRSCFPFFVLHFPLFVRNASFRLIFPIRRIQTTNIWTKLQNSTALCLICAVQWRVVQLHRDAIYSWKETWDLKTTLAKWVRSLIAYNCKRHKLFSPNLFFFPGGRSLFSTNRYAAGL